MPREYMTYKQAAEYLGITHYMLRNYCNRGDGPRAVVLGQRTKRFRPVDLDKWMADRLELA